MQTKQPTQVIIFGATGNLARIKLYPALFNLFVSDSYGVGVCKIIGVSRRDWQDSDFVQEVRSYLEQHHADYFSKHNDRWDEFSKLLQFASVDFQDPASYANLYQRLDENDKTRQKQGESCYRRLYYYSVAPEFFAEITSELHNSGLIETGNEDQQVVVEKPFGLDYRSAENIYSLMQGKLTEGQINRIDHVLNKEVLEDIFGFRLNNTVINRLLGREFVDHVQVVYSEDIGIADRGSFYESVGALRDMVQSHMLETAALVMANCGSAVSPESLYEARAEIIRSFELVSAADLVIGQYGSGEVNGQKVKAYREHDEVAGDSDVETFVALKLVSRHPDWQDVPVYFKTGKRLEKKYFDVHVVFKSEAGGEQRRQNVLTFRVSPNSGVNLRLWRQPDLHQPAEIQPVDLTYCYRSNQIVDAYERLFRRLLEGKKLLFVSIEEILASWEIIDRVRSHYKGQSLATYPPGSRGPQAAEELIAKDGRRWLGGEISDICNFTPIQL